jgi:hypothetical protein
MVVDVSMKSSLCALTWAFFCFDTASWRIPEFACQSDGVFLVDRLFWFHCTVLHSWKVSWSYHHSRQQNWGQAITIDDSVHHWVLSAFLSTTIGTDVASMGTWEGWMEHVWGTDSCCRLLLRCCRSSVLITQDVCKRPNNPRTRQSSIIVVTAGLQAQIAGQCVTGNGLVGMWKKGRRQSTKYWWRTTSCCEGLKYI